MFKKLIFASLFSLLLAVPSQAQVAENFDQMSPTVKIKSYKTLFIDEVLLFGSGSGTVISPEGLVVTNNHVIFDEDEFKPLDAFEVCITFDVKGEPLCKYTATLVDHNKDMDIALLKINSLDVFGNPLPELKFLNYKNSATPKEQTEIRVNGYPGSGGKTITSTKGQISGFDEFNGFNYFKTDTDFDHGSSGGTALDPDGNYIGIPTYIRSYAENVGYFLDLREAQSWLDQAVSKASKTKESTSTGQKIVEQEVSTFFTANQNKVYVQSQYPYLKSVLPEGWEFLEITDNTLFAFQKNLSNPVGLSVQVLPYQFEITQSYLDKLDEELERIKDTFSDYKKEEVVFAGQKAWKITYTSISNYNVTYYVPYGYALVAVNYSIDLDEFDKQSSAIQPVLDQIQFTKTALSEPKISNKVQFKNPDFSIQSAGEWRFQLNHEKRSKDLLVEAVEKNNFEGSFTIYYSQVSKDERSFSDKDRLAEVVKNLRGQKLVYKNDEVVLGGLKGFLYTYEYEGQKYQQIRKNLVIQVRDGDYEFTIQYDDLTLDFDRNLPVVKKMLDSFAFKGSHSSQNIETSYGNLGFTFSDLQFHRYALAIGELADKKIIEGDDNGSFNPEELVSRAQAIKWIFESKNHLESERNPKKIIDFNKYDQVGYADIALKNHPFRKYAYYGQEVGYIKKNKSGFRPNDSINLAEALTLILKTYEIPVWSLETNPWYKKYIDKGFELRLIPYGMYNPAQLLTRAELAYLINEIYQQSK